MTGPAPRLDDLDERSRDIFRRVVDHYLTLGEPLGSRTLSRDLTKSNAMPTLSPATIRNVMSDLEALGLVFAPHVSAGRLPTELGLRFFVDAFMEVGAIPPEARAALDDNIGTGRPKGSVEDALTETSSLLSGLTAGAGLVLASKSDTRLKHIEFIRLEPTKGLVVLVGEDGNIENRLIDLPEGLPASALTEAANFLNAHLRGKTLGEAQRALAERERAVAAELDKLTRQVVDAGIASWAGAEEGKPRQLIIRGRANLLEDVSAVEDLERIRLLFEDLDSKKELARLLSAAETADGVRIFIGSENKLFSLSGSSMIVAPYHDEAGTIVGAVGVIGPTRLNYQRIVPVVDYTASLVSKLVSPGRS
ncbi:MAG: heat-inducible transcriptional repressor HrcA [Rhizobiales bacterium]|nr:heat-inducible transcriptional repressor HrcA [Hyphomicrobiales bacterium]MBO6699426.1 heat-inducible transcriptional repressor HrcA [Hyphomicrobiales bacterium]MBO6736964.1 heat-inducible transcriptional repressor HrcA [Hyphomicrobiales bacterium]MBO6911962.1 heat-inducible transcriptional repressor HrcA [Hyphomicrobiales bacterium]MBO6957049.1 heat-inducible transcriptional repressor HrcA [Hyphomicrobiales bacterium]